MSEPINRRAAKFVFKHLSKNFDGLKEKPLPIRHHFKEMEENDDVNDLIPGEIIEEEKESSPKQKKIKTNINIETELHKIEDDISKTIKNSIHEEEEDRFDLVIKKLDDIERKLNVAKTEMRLNKERDKDKISMLSKKINEMSQKLELQIYKRNTRDTRMKELEEKIKNSVDINIKKSVSIEDQLHSIEKRLSTINVNPKKIEEIKERIRKSKKRIKKD